jgi:hypothetical protein
MYNKDGYVGITLFVQLSNPLAFTKKNTYS